MRNSNGDNLKISVLSKQGHQTSMTKDYRLILRAIFIFSIHFHKEDNGILVEEVQNLTEAVQHLTSEREQMAANLQEMRLTYHQHEALRQEFTQVEIVYLNSVRFGF